MLLLTLTVRGLERDGFLTRTVFPTIPPRVDYELTALGHSPLVPVALWATGRSKIAPISKTPNVVLIKRRARMPMAVA